MFKLEKEYVLRISDFDCRDALRPASVLDLFQDVSAQHAERLGIGYQAMLERGLIWVIMRIRYKMEHPAQMYERIKVSTALRPPGRAASLRDCCIRDQAGHVLVRGTTQWTVIDRDTRRIAPLAGVLPPCEPDGTEPAFEKLGRLAGFETEDDPYAVTPGFSSLDRNGHVNNARYADLVLDAVKLRENEEIDVFQIDYLHEVLAGEKLELFVLRENGKIRVKACNASGKTMFLCEILLK